MKKIVLLALALSICSIIYTAPSQDHSDYTQDCHSKWHKVKKVLTSKPAKIAYGVIVIVLGGPYFIVKIKKYADEKERERSLRNGRIVFSWLGEASVSQESRESELVGCFRDRYMPDSRDPWFHYRPYYYGIEQWSRDFGVEVVIRDRGILNGNPNSLLHTICRDINDMNFYTASNGNSANWTAVIEKQEYSILPGLPLKEDFDVPRYQVRITIPSASTN